MGQKVSPHGLRVGVINDWDSKWYADKKNFGALLKEDHEIRTYIKKTLFTAGISRVRATMAVWDDILPLSVTKAFIFSNWIWLVSAGERFCATSMTRL